MNFSIFFCGPRALSAPTIFLCQFLTIEASVAVREFVTSSTHIKYKGVNYSCTSRPLPEDLLAQFVLMATGTSPSEIVWGDEEPTPGFWIARLEALADPTTATHEPPLAARKPALRVTVPNTQDARLIQPPPYHQVDEHRGYAPQAQVPADLRSRRRTLYSIPAITSVGPPMHSSPIQPVTVEARMNALLDQQSHIMEQIDSLAQAQDGQVQGGQAIQTAARNSPVSQLSNLDSQGIYHGSSPLQAVSTTSPYLNVNAAASSTTQAVSQPVMSTGSSTGAGAPQHVQPAIPAYPVASVVASSISSVPLPAGQSQPTVRFSFPSTPGGLPAFQVPPPPVAYAPSQAPPLQQYAQPSGLPMTTFMAPPAVVHTVSPVPPASAAVAPVVATTINTVLPSQATNNSSQLSQQNGQASSSALAAAANNSNLVFQPAPRLEMKPPKLKDCTGEREVQKGHALFEHWIKDVRMKRKEHTEIAMKAAIGQSLSGPAHRVFHIQPPDASLDDILDSLEQYFGIIDDQDKLHEDYYSITQGENESVAELAARVQTEAARINKLVGYEQIGEKANVWRFFHAMFERYQNALSYLMPDVAFQKLLKEARIRERGKKLKKQQQNQRIRAHALNVDDGSEDESGDAQLEDVNTDMTAQLAALQSQLEEIIAAQAYVPGGQPRNQPAAQGNSGGGQSRQQNGSGGTRRPGGNSRRNNNANRYQNNANQPQHVPPPHIPLQVCGNCYAAGHDARACQQPLRAAGQGNQQGVQPAGNQNPPVQAPQANQLAQQAQPAQPANN